MPDYTDIYNLYKPTVMTDAFGSVFLPEMASNMEKIEDELTKVNQIRVNASGGDDTAAIQDAINAAAGEKWLVLSGTYNISAPITGQKVKILANDATILDSSAGETLDFRGVSRGTFSATAGYTKGRNYLLMPATTGIEPGDLIRFVSTTELYHPSRNYYYKGGNFVVSKVVADRVYFAGSLPYDITAVDVVEVYDPAKVTIQGQLRIENTGALPNGTFGLRLERCANSVIEGLTVDNYDTCITPRYSSGLIFRNCNTERSWYSGTGQSYGLSTISSSNILYENCNTRSGRHGHAGGGWEPIDMIYFKNCNIFAETEGLQFSFDLHDNAGRIMLEDCTMDSFTVIGNVTMRNCVVNHLEKDSSSFKSSDEDYKCNYIFENMVFPNGGEVALTGYAQSGGTWTMNQIGNFVARNWVTGGDNISMHLDFKAKDEHVSMPKQYIRGIIFENTVNVQLLLKDDVRQLHIRNSTYLLDNVHLYQYEGMIDSVMIENCQLVSRYNGVYFTGFKVAKLVNCTAFTTASTTGSIVLNSAGARATLDTCEFGNMARGLSASVSKLALINSNIPIYSNTSTTTVTV
jgi:hypothetical protein